MPSHISYVSRLVELSSDARSHHGDENGQELLAKHFAQDYHFGQ